MNRLLPVLWLALVGFFIGMPAFSQTPSVLLMDGNHLAKVKGSAKKDKLLSTQLEALVKEADALLEMKPVSVMEKAFTPVSGNKHDYMSQAPYFWYDSSKPNGRPYMRRDGVRNPEIYKITDRSHLGKLDQATHTLALAWYLTGEEKYAAKAAALLRVWFLEETTKMNPHLNYAQAIPGINDGRGIGIIETVALTGIADAAILLSSSGSWKATDQQGLKQWYNAYLDWMLSSKNGQEEYAAKNNHGTWFYVQAVDFALFCGKTEQARALAEESKVRLDSQLTAEGSQPLELERTTALGYSTYNLQAWFMLATLAKRVNVNLWDHTTSKGAGLRKALDWLTPYAFGEKAWPYQQINPYNKNDMFLLMARAAGAWAAPVYSSRAKALADKIKDPAEVLVYSR
ncbi:alginate lyase family protein [Paraflavitalea sp. CAU 1676]|uniref:alginate lyase family protein n=1 Tax=Paraflavitalea sp. CAU 1676 TaxID=3032598 RepID=UPI0023D9C9F6|nr:alginate lyase family protein [Paraflavitalea sp. CAU 1676]MDF2193338.1 alginate lyase family protein [Paraflavitalea sp. CAU 1676]